MLAGLVDFNILGGWEFQDLAKGVKDLGLMAFTGRELQQK